MPLTVGTMINRHLTVCEREKEGERARARVCMRGFECIHVCVCGRGYVYSHVHTHIRVYIHAHTYKLALFLSLSLTHTHTHTVTCLFVIVPTVKGIQAKGWPQSNYANSASYMYIYEAELA